MIIRDRDSLSLFMLRGKERMIKKLYPTHHVKSVFSINYKKLYDMGYRGIMFDIDATLVPHGQDITYNIELLLDYIHQLGFKVLFLSNNSEDRISHFNRRVQLPYIALADKPNTIGYQKALMKLNIPKEKVLMIGDQLMTDILGANQSGIDSILVDFLPQKGETKLGKKRCLELLLLRHYHRQKNAQNLGNIERGSYE